MRRTEVTEKLTVSVGCQEVSLFDSLVGRTVLFHVDPTEPLLTMIGDI
jgi:hypothetical protein